MASVTDEKESVLKFTDVTLSVGSSSATTVWDANMHLHGGELAVVHMGQRHIGSLLADAGSGLLPPTKGTIHFQGQEWTQISPDRANALRGSIGRVFDRHGWISHRTLAENIMLSQLYHTGRPYADILKEAQQLAQTFGLPGVPSGSVDRLLPADLQRAACVRAFMGQPVLLLLENPTRGVYSGIMGALVNTLSRARAGGAAVLWLTDNERVWRDQAIHPTQRYRMAGSQLVLMDGV